MTYSEPYHFDELIQDEYNRDVCGVKRTCCRSSLYQCALVAFEQMPVQAIFAFISISCAPQSLTQINRVEEYDLTLYE